MGAAESGDVATRNRWPSGDDPTSTASSGSWKSASGSPPLAPAALNNTDTALTDPWDA